MGRKDFNGTANPTGLLSQPTDSVAKIVARFADMGFTDDQMVALIGAHTIGRQGFTDPSLAGSSFDSTNNIWDSTFCTFSWSRSVCYETNDFFQSSSTPQKG
jgi:catalase (peroxidase I)